MPYYVGAGSPEWDEFVANEDSDTPPLTSFQYVEPWQATTVVAFSNVLGPEPAVPSEPPYPGRHAKPLPKLGLWARLRGKKLPPTAPPPEPTPEQWHEWHEARKNLQKARSEHALWKVSAAASSFRAQGVSRIFGSYDGGGDESFACVRLVEFGDGRRREYDGRQQSSNFESIFFDAVSAIMGRFDAGEFILHGAITIDLDACTITDEKDPSIVFRNFGTTGD